jgi:hypothetical protein
MGESWVDRGENREEEGYVGEIGERIGKRRDMWER